MKTLKASISIFVFLLIAGTSFAQKGYEDGSKFGHGEDSIQCIRNYSLFSEYYKQKNYPDALPYWRQAFHDCPLVSSNIYTRGATMYKYFIIKANNANDIKLKNALVDTLMGIYDQRMKWYPSKKPMILNYKATDIMKFKSKDPHCVAKAYEFSSEAIGLYKSKAPKSLIQNYMKSTFLMFENMDIDEANVVENYAATIAILDAQLEKAPDDEDLETLKDNISNNFANSGAASCEALIQLFTPQFEATPEDVDVLKKISFWLNNTGCTDSKLYLDATIALNKVEPSADLAYHIAKLYNEKKKFQTAVNFYKQAIEQEIEPTLRSKYYFELGLIIHSEFSDLQEAKSLALKAIKDDPASGRPYLLLGNVYSSAKNYGGDDEVLSKAVYWVAVDQYKKARNLDEDLAGMCNEKIAFFSQYFPDKNTLFFYGINDGDAYKVGGWINENTLVREKK